MSASHSAFLCKNGGKHWNADKNNVLPLRNSAHLADDTAFTVIYKRRNAPAPATGLHNVHIRIMENRLSPGWGVLRSKCLATKYQLYSCLFVVRLIKDKAEFFRDCVELLLRRDIKFLKNERVNLIIVNFLLLIMRDEVGKIHDTAQHF